MDARLTGLITDPGPDALDQLADLVRERLERSRLTADALPDLATCCAGWLERLRKRGLAHNTLLAYRSDIGRALAFFVQRGVRLPQQVTPRLVEAWLDHEAATGRSRRTQSRRLAALKSMWRYVMTEGLTGHDPTEGVAVRYRPRPVIAPEMQALLVMVRRIRAATPTDQRDRAILRLALDSGLRISELAALDVYNPAAVPENTVDLDRLAVHVVGKGGVAATLPIDPATAREIEAWLCVRGQMAADGMTALFVHARGGRMSRQTLHQMVRKRGAAAGMPGLHMHLLRHRRIGQVVAQMGVHAGRYMARHASAATTLAVYGQQADEVVRRQIRQGCPLEAQP